MSRFATLLLIVVACLLFSGEPLGAGVTEERLTARGDANNDLRVDVSDVVFLSAYVKGGVPQPPCMDQADADDDGRVSTRDVVYLAEFLFRGGSPPPAPGPVSASCRRDPTPDSLRCDSSGCL